METGLKDLMLIIHQECHLAVPFNAAQRIDDDSPKAFWVFCRFKRAHGVITGSVRRSGAIRLEINTHEC